MNQQNIKIKPTRKSNLTLMRQKKKKKKKKKI